MFLPVTHTTPLYSKKTYQHFEVNPGVNLQDWGDEAGNGFFEFYKVGTVIIKCWSKFFAKFHVLFKDVGEFLGGGFVIDEGVNFEVKVEAPDIKVGGAYGAYFFIDYNCFSVKEAVFISITVTPTGY